MYIYHTSTHIHTQKHKHTPYSVSFSDAWPNYLAEAPGD